MCGTVEAIYVVRQKLLTRIKSDKTDKNDKKYRHVLKILKRTPLG